MALSQSAIVAAMTRFDKDAVYENFNNIAYFGGLAVQYAYRDHDNDGFREIIGY